MKSFYYTLGFFSILLFLQDATAFPGIGRRFFRSSTNSENGPAETRDAVIPTDQYDVDADLREVEANGEPFAPANQITENQIPPTILRKLRQRYGDQYPQILANINRNPQALSQLTDLETRGKLKKLTGIAFVLALLKIIF